MFFSYASKGAYAEIENDFRNYLNCFKALEGTFTNSDKDASGYFENGDIKVFYIGFFILF